MKTGHARSSLRPLTSIGSSILVRSVHAMLKNSARRRWRVTAAANIKEMPWLALLFPKPCGATVKRFSSWLDLSDYFPSPLAASRKDGRNASPIGIDAPRLVANLSPIGFLASAGALRIRAASGETSSNCLKRSLRSDSNGVSGALKRRRGSPRTADRDGKGRNRHV
jgi:hypothetical protein